MSDALISHDQPGAERPETVALTGIAPIPHDEMEILAGIRGLSDEALAQRLSAPRRPGTWIFLADADLFADANLWNRLERIQSADVLKRFVARVGHPLPPYPVMRAAALAGLTILQLELADRDLPDDFADELAALVGLGIQVQIVVAGSPNALARWPDLPVPRIVPAGDAARTPAFAALLSSAAYGRRLSAFLDTVGVPPSVDRLVEAHLAAAQRPATAETTLARIDGEERALVIAALDRSRTAPAAALHLPTLFRLRLADLATFTGVEPAAEPAPTVVTHAGFRLEVLAAPEPGCADLTYTRFWWFWTMRRPDWLAVAARDSEGEIRALALLSEASVVEGRIVRRLLSITVAKSARGVGLGRALLAHAGDRAVALGTQRLIAGYATEMASRPAFEKMLAGAGWGTPEPAEYTIAGQVKWVKIAEEEWRPLLTRARRQGLTMMPWTELTETDHADIRRSILEREARPEWHPDLFLRPGSEPFSLLLRYHGRVVGWIIGEKADDVSVHYRRGCVFPPYRRHGFLIAGLHEACRRQSELLGPDSVCVNWATAGSDMARFMESRLMPLVVARQPDVAAVARGRDERPHGLLDIRMAAMCDLDQRTSVCGS